MVATYLAVIKAGGIVVATMPLLRARELATIIEKARDRACRLRPRLPDELAKAPDSGPC